MGASSFFSWIWIFMMITSLSMSVNWALWTFCFFRTWPRSSQWLIIFCWESSNWLFQHREILSAEIVVAFHLWDLVMNLIYVLLVHFRSVFHHLRLEISSMRVRFALWNIFLTRFSTASMCSFLSTTTTTLRVCCREHLRLCFGHYQYQTPTVRKN